MVEGNEEVPGWKLKVGIRRERERERKSHAMSRGPALTTSLLFFLSYDFLFLSPFFSPLVAQHSQTIRDALGMTPISDSPRNLNSPIMQQTIAADEAIR